MSKIKVALIGHGHLGKWHAQKVEQSEHADLYAIVDFSKQTREQVKKLYPDAYVTKELKEILNQIDAAIIASPTSFHADTAKLLLENNIHVFCEKPVSDNLNKTYELEKLSQTKSDLVFQIGHSERCHKIFDDKAIRNTFKDAFYLNFKRLAPFKARATDVDVVSDLMIHDIDLMLWLTDKKVNCVEAIGKKYVTDHWDYVQARFHLPGLIVDISAGRFNVEEQRQIDCMSNSGHMRIDLANNKYLFNQSDNNEMVSLSYEKRDHLKLEQEYFYQSILHNGPAFVGINEGREACYYIEQVHRSLKQGSAINCKEV